MQRCMSGLCEHISGTDTRHTVYRCICFNCVSGSVVMGMLKLILGQNGCLMLGGTLVEALSASLNTWCWIPLCCCCATVPLYHCAPVPLCHCATVHLCPVPLCFWAVPLCLWAPVPMCHCAPVPLCTCAPVPLCTCAPVRLCSYANVPLCHVPRAPVPSRWL